MILKSPIHKNIDQIQTNDRERIDSLVKNIQYRKSNNLPVDRMEKKCESLVLESKNKSKHIAHKIKSLEFDPSLPIVEKYQEIVELIQNHQVVIVAGETGCGKTTQLPKICLMAGLGVRGKIAHTQPRRVAATSVASRIANEVKSPLGELVGYSVRFSERISANTRIKLMTDGILLAELQSDPLLSQYEVIIIDEAHERSLNIDFLLGFLKRILEYRNDLKIIVTSATIDPESFSRYFNNAPTLIVEGRTFPVTVNYQPLEDTESSQSDPLLDGICNAVDSCIAHSTGDILIFSHGEAEIKAIAQSLKKQYKTELEILPLYARLGIKEQQNIFKSSKKRKVVIATNVAETSLTIPNIVFVIDIGTARISRYSQRNKIQQLPIEKISQASAEQRKGRCGRIAPGICIRLYSKEDYESRSEYTLAEIKRTNLSSVVLRLKSMQVDDVEKFPFIQMPDQRQWKVAFNLLFELAAMNDKRQITAIGRKMAKLPLDPQLARIVLNENLAAVDEILIIASFLTTRDIRIRPQDKTQKADQIHAKYIDKASDMMSVVKLWRTIEKSKKELSNSAFKRWCQTEMLNFVGWLEWRNVYYQIKESALDVGIKVQTEHASAEQVHRELVSGFISHVLLKTPERFYQGARGIKVWLHPSSQFFKSGTQWMLSTELMETDRLYARGNIPIKPEWIIDVAPHLIKSNYQDIHWRKNKSCAGAFLNQTLLGLPIVNKKLVDYSRVNEGESRSIFLLEGLAKNNIGQTYPFLKKNYNTLEEIEQHEKRLRSMDVRISNQALAELYGSKLPENINNGFLLRKWLKKDWHKRNSNLIFSQQELSQKELESTEEFPSEIVIRGVTLNLSYSFSPGKKNDGVTVELPLEMADQFRDSDFDWLVPGYLEEKVLFVIKLLPKTTRKQLFPLSDTAKKCCELMHSDNYRKLTFKSALAAALKRIKNIEVSLREVDLNELPTHLLMKFKSRNGNNKSVFQSSRLSELHFLSNSISTDDKAGRNSIKASIINSTSEISETKLTRFPNRRIEIESIQKSGKHQIRLFFGLFDCDSWVEVRTFSSKEQAEYYHDFGIARLLLLDQSKVLRSLKNGWPERRIIEKLNIRFGGFSKILDWTALSVALQTVKQFKKRISEQQDFDRLAKIFSEKIRENISLQLISVEKLLLQLDSIYSELSRLKSDVYLDSTMDIKTQIEGLWCQNRFIDMGDELYTYYQRYFLAITSRISRIKDNYPKEKQALENWLEWHEWWCDLSEEQLDFDTLKPLNSLFWMLEEYRISLFSIGVKTQGSISAKKLQKAFEVIEELFDK